MPTKRIGDLPTDVSSVPQIFCQDRQHEPDTMVVRKPGVYEHTCPRCGKSIIFTVLRDGQMRYR